MTHANPTLRLQKEVPLGNPDVLVCSVGTEIFFEASGAAPEANKQWAAELDQGWSRQKAIDLAGSFPELKPQACMPHGTSACSSCHLSMRRNPVQGGSPCDVHCTAFGHVVV
jgi:hypothetical protein